jgi:hypothetical protein
VSAVVEEMQGKLSGLLNLKVCFNVVDSCIRVYFST